MGLGAMACISRIDVGQAVSWMNVAGLTFGNNAILF